MPINRTPLSRFLAFLKRVAWMQRSGIRDSFAGRKTFNHPDSVALHPGYLCWIGSLVLSAAFSSGAAADGNPDDAEALPAGVVYQGKDPGRFALTKGHGMEVCEAYLERLTTADYKEVREPRCDRPDNPNIEDFPRLNRVVLTPSELHDTYERLIGFANHQDQDHYEKERKRRLSFCENPKTEAGCKREMEYKTRAEARGDRFAEPYDLKELSTGLVVAWRYEPEIDIDNDGQADHLLLFKDHHNGCGTENYRGYIAGGPTNAFIMDPSYQTVDEERTREVFGHPYPWKYKEFRYIGEKVGVLSYKGQFYFDTFFRTQGDFENQRQADKTLGHTLGVFHRQDQITQQVCEYRWHYPYDTRKGE